MRALYCSIETPWYSDRVAEGAGRSVFSGRIVDILGGRSAEELVSFTGGMDADLRGSVSEV